MTYRTRLGTATALALMLMAGVASDVQANDFKEPGGDGCAAIPTMQSVYTSLKDALRTAVAQDNGGLGNEMWGTIVDRHGIVCAVAFSGADPGAQWPGSRVISAQKANTANAFSLHGVYPNVPLGRALASGNLYGLVLEQGGLYGLQFSNPVDPRVAYGDNLRPNGADSTKTPGYGRQDDPMVGTYIGGVNVFGGGLALYDLTGEVVGGLGVSGDTACTDHIIAWRVRDSLGLDNIPGGVAPGATPAGSDNLVLADTVQPNTFQHPRCGFGEDDIIEDLPETVPTGSE